ncbi:MAG: hypothetical protein LBB04_03570 [Oscillospiraceae bacterium]|jgi:hypothetical protein|nr:hypothetical protein [Oscillospiraceae bacterium]
MAMQSGIICDEERKELLKSRQKMENLLKLQEKLLKAWENEMGKNNVA